uniref:Uncharacterized protein n=1 Tax=Myoviridae sp. ct0Tg8 TaxID=2826598 RepID=A0A8S5NBE2_9CAUD|nr:MAG TPA: hypothetical protein [Myoviridae sp. ct0Tg8]DAP36115.1 MAG TPA: hypothetical protein [Caudoviricetes sp.]DAQ45095.1 MAG TPA: hypothetical protein [Caudoviricetes sp.]
MASILTGRGLFYILPRRDFLSVVLVYIFSYHTQYNHNIILFN